MDNQVRRLYDSTSDAYNWCEKLLDGIDHTLWETIPTGIESSVNWQVGHLTLSFYYHTMMVIVGHQKHVLSDVPMNEYNKYFAQNNPNESIGKFDSVSLMNNFRMMTIESLKVISSLSVQDLDASLVKSSSPHPVANSKWEALDWNIKHTMWHCGQLAILRRILHDRFDFKVK